MKKCNFFTLILFFLTSISIFGQTTNPLDSAWIKDNYTKQEVMVPMRDGIKLFTSIYTPKNTTEPRPILMSRTPYSCSPYGVENFRPFWNTHWRYYMRRNYIIVIQDVRGRYMSEGDFVDVRPYKENKKGKETDEASDTYDAIDWLVKNIPNNNSKVGIFGISYPGFYSTIAALSNHPSLVAVSPQAPVTDWFMGDDFHHNGAFFMMDGFAFYSSFGKPRPKPTTNYGPGFDFPTKDTYKFYLEAGSTKKLKEMMGDSIAFFQEMYKHPNLDDYWKAKNVRNFVQHIPSHTASLIVGGLFDAEDLFGAWKTYEAIESKASNNNRIIMGPWSHGQWARGEGNSLGNVEFDSNTSWYYQNEIEMPFFIHHLEGKANIDKLAEATVFFTGENKWRNLPKWPVNEVQMVPVYLDANEKLHWKRPESKTAFTEYVSDPNKPVPYTEDVHFRRTATYMTDDQRFANRRPDVLSFQTEILTEDITLAGPVIANILTSITGTDVDFIVKVIDVFPSDFSYGDEVESEGRLSGGSYPMGDYQMLVRGEVMRGKFRNSFEKPEPFTPNKVEKVSFELPDVAHTFKKGHRIMIQIQSTWFPLVDRNPQKFVNIYEANADDYQKINIKVHHDETNASNIILPILK
jgi:putative CocE/NonD family hydrolase